MVSREPAPLGAYRRFLAALLVLFAAVAAVVSVILFSRKGVFFGLLPWLLIVYLLLTARAYRQEAREREEQRGGG
ncbi:MAG: hypothetical protein ACE5JG_06930 [Planctomycetota bacterium]